jgi:hypothetical protein
LFDQRTTNLSCIFPRALKSRKGMRMMGAPPAALVKKLASPALRMFYIVIWLLFLAWDCPAQTGPTEHQVKAAFIYNFAKFVDWPAATNAPPGSPIIIGLLGENVFHDDITTVINGKNVNNHPLQFHQYRSIEEVTNCQILFISPSEQKHFIQIIAELHHASILTVGETDHFIEDGGMIDFVVVEKKIRFQINNDAAKKAGLTISSKLLSLAVK